LLAARLFVVIALAGAMAASALDWSTPERELARKITALTGNTPVVFSFQNRSSLGRRDAEIIQNGMRSSLEALGVHFNQGDASAATVAISLSENVTSYLLVAELRKAGGERSVVMTSTLRPASVRSGLDSMPLTVRKTLLWSQANLILDVAVVEENSSSSRIAVLEPEKVSLYRAREGRAQLEQTVDISHSKPWPRDLRGMVVPARDHLLDVYLPGVACRGLAGTAIALNCRETDDPWPLVPSSISSTATPQAFFSPGRNFFSVALNSSGTSATAINFYSGAWISREKNPLWIFVALDGQVHLLDGGGDRIAKLNWGSDLAGVRTACGAGWQLLATSPGTDGTDFVRAYEVPDRDPVAVSPTVDFSGPISAMWTEAKGDTAVAIAKNLETGNYEAFRLSMACAQ
jgi:hypothetical protein